MASSALSEGPGEAGWVLVLAHGAGAGMHSDFMQAIAHGVAAAGIRVVRFDFPYMVKARELGKRRPPDRLPKLQEAFREQVAALGEVPVLVLGGKSMGGRVASTLADELGAAGLVALGFPFHAPGRPDKLDRVEAFKAVRTPALVLQGERDPFGTAQEVPRYGLGEQVRVVWLPDGDHSLKPRKKSGFTHEQHLATAVGEIVAFVRGL